MRRFATPSLAVLLVLGVLLCFGQVIHHQFLSYDDGGYITANPVVQQGLTWHGFAWAFTAKANATWHPLTLISHMLDCQLYGLDAGRHKITSVVFHAANAVLLLVLLVRMTGAVWRSGLVAALFALHPLHVQSVAWVSERKDVLSTFFGFLAILAYASYAQRPEWRRYLPVLAFMALSLLAKPMFVTLPFLLLLLDYWPLRRLRLGHAFPADADHPSLRLLILEKVPLLALTVGSSIVTYYVQNIAGALPTVDAVPMGARVANAVVAYGTYLSKMVWPTGLVFFYAYPLTWSVWPVVASAVLLAAITLLALGAARRWPFIPVGWFWYLGTLVPVSGLVQVGSHAMADRYTYVPLIGVFIMIAWAVPDRVLAIRAARTAIAAVALTIVVALAAWTTIQVSYWRNDHTLFEHAALADPGNFMAHLNYGGTLAGEGRLADASEEFQTAIRLRPRYARAYFDYGWTLAAMKHFQEAADAYRQVLRLEPDHARAHANIAAALEALSHHDEALGELRLAVQDDPRNLVFLQALANSLVAAKRPAEAIGIYRKILAVDHRQPGVQNNLGNLYLQLGDRGSALGAYLAAAALDPASPVYHENAGNVFLEGGNFPAAAEQFKAALSSGPESVALHRKLAAALVQTGQFDGATTQVTQACRLEPANADLHALLGGLLAQCGRFDDAERELNQALALNPKLTSATHILELVRDARQKARQ